MQDRCPRRILVLLALGFGAGHFARAAAGVLRLVPGGAGDLPADGDCRGAIVCLR